jgi:hypothetical protein
VRYEVCRPRKNNSPRFNELEGSLNRRYVWFMSCARNSLFMPAKGDLGTFSNTLFQSISLNNKICCNGEQGVPCLFIISCALDCDSSEAVCLSSTTLLQEYCQTYS